MRRLVAQAPLAILLAFPLVLLALATPAPERALALLAALPAVAGLLVVERALRARVPDASRFWALAMGAYGTGLLPLLAHASDARRATAFLLGALGLLAAPRGVPLTAARAAALATAVAAGAALGGLPDQKAASPDVLRALFGSRDGLLFWTPLLWACVAGHAALLRSEGRRVLPLTLVALAPFALAPLFDGGGRVERYDWALPSLLLGLAAGLEALRRAVERRPAWLLAAFAPALAVSNLLFMEQYRQSPRRDDTLSFPEVSEGNARLLAASVGSPPAWPANWIWGSRHNLPVERWDLLSGQRLDPRAAALEIDVGRLEQDSAFLFDGWSVRHACADAVCRQVEGRAEAVLPLERAGALRARLRASGSGVLHVELNRVALAPIRLGPELAWLDLPAAPWRRGPNRLVFLIAPTGEAHVDRLRLERAD